MDFGFIADETFRYSFTAKGFETLFGVVESIAVRELTIYVYIYIYILTRTCLFLWSTLGSWRGSFRSFSHSHSIRSPATRTIETMPTFKDFLILSNQQSASIFLQCEVNQTLAPFTSRTYFAMFDMLANSAWPDVEKQAKTFSLMESYIAVMGGTIWEQTSTEARDGASSHSPRTYGRPNHAC